MDAADGFTQQFRYAESDDLVTFRHGDGVGADELFDRAFCEAFHRQLIQNGVGDGSINAAGPTFFEKTGGGGEGAGGFCHVVDQENIASFDFADDVMGFDLGSAGPVLGNDGVTGTKGPREGMRHFNAPDIRRDDDYFLSLKAGFADVLEQDGSGVEVVDRDIEETLDLPSVEVHREDPLDSSGGEEIGDQLGGDGDARLVFAILPGIAKKRDHGGDALRTGAPDGIQEISAIVEVKK